jgi:predicted cation transporter
MPEVTLVDVALFVIFLIVLAAPFRIRIVEHNLELFLFVMGALAVTVTGKWGMELVLEAVEEPVLKGIVPAVLIAGLLFYYGRSIFQNGINTILRKIPTSVFIFLVVTILGLISSVITAIIAALLLVEIVNLMPLARKDKINLVIIACFSIGLGAVLTPLGEPLSTIAISKLSGAPYHATFLYLFDQLGILVIIGVLASAAFGVFWVRRSSATGSATAAVANYGGGVSTDTVVAGIGIEIESEDEHSDEEEGSLREVIMRTVKVYAFVAALFLLGAGMGVIIDKYVIQLPAALLKLEKI